MARLVGLLGPRDPDVPAYRWLADGLRLLIADGRLPSGQALPSERRLTEALDLSRTTVTRAYAVLVEDGFLRARQGSGHVATLPLGQQRVGVGGALLPGFGTGEALLDLTCAAGRAPVGTAEAYAKAVQQLPSYLAGTGYATAGLPQLQALIAQRYAQRGLPTEPDQILVVSGALSGVSLAVRALTRPGDPVLVETPSYPNSVDAARRSGARLIPIAVEPDGWDLEAIASTVAATRPVAAQLILDFHNPTGALMLDAEREQLAAALRRAGTVAIVDETMLEVELDEVERPLPFAAHLSRTILVGSSSKSHWGGLRTGWLRVPRPLLPRLLQARIADDLGAPILEQLTLTELLAARPGLHPESRAALRASRQAMVDALPSALPGARWTVPAGGLSLWVELPEPRSRQLAAAARELELLISPGPQFALQHGLDSFVRLPYKDPAEVVTEAIGRLAQAWLAVQESPGRRAGSALRPVVA
ncbi:GntR family transcriptional regulator [Propionicimonas paludicola]|uniref:GntR family transcriptional regulator n=2 Tax=Propionicimonas paludicola TaxID=185243 RepID=A0A2A9CP90_9ACTN|nr:GntR family transcriptional regulator [Propionicimonas paludicola]